VDDDGIILRIDDEQQCGVGDGASDEARARFIDCQAQVGDGVEVQILEGGHGGHQRAQHSKVFERGGYPEFH
jgi:hypothetical protein